MNLRILDVYKILFSSGQRKIYVAQAGMNLCWENCGKINDICRDIFCR